MAYTPPDYPSTIPGTTDLPDRVDDIDWWYAARYNELKKELRAVMIELGVLPKGGSADVAARLDAMGAGFVDRGDPSANDFDENNLTIDSAWHTLDLSSIVPAGAIAASLHAAINCIATPGLGIIMKKNGNTYSYSRSKIIQTVANISQCGDLVTPVDGDRKIEYHIASAIDTVVITVKGWWF